MSKFKKKLKLIKQLQREIRQEEQQEQAICSHTKKNGESRLRHFTDGDILKGECTKCGRIVILDEAMLQPEMIQNSVETLHTVMAEVRTQARLGGVQLPKDLEKLMVEFDARVMSELPALLDEAAEARRREQQKRTKKKDKDYRWAGYSGKDKKKGKKKKNRREKWN